MFSKNCLKQYKSEILSSMNLFIAFESHIKINGSSNTSSSSLRMHLSEMHTKSQVETLFHKVQNLNKFMQHWIQRIMQKIIFAYVYFPLYFVSHTLLQQNNFLQTGRPLGIKLNILRQERPIRVNTWKRRFDTNLALQTLEVVSGQNFQKLTQPQGISVNLSEEHPRIKT